MGCLIGEVARRVGLSARTIRFYEGAGLLPSPHRLAQPRRHPGYRFYDDKEIRLVKLVADLRACGLSLKEMKELLGFVQAGCCGLRDDQYRAFLARKLTQTETRITKLDVLRRSLRAALDHGNGKCACAPEESLCTCVVEPLEGWTGKERGRATALERNGARSKAFETMDNRDSHGLGRAGVARRHGDRKKLVAGVNKQSREPSMGARGIAANERGRAGE